MSAASELYDAAHAALEAARAAYSKLGRALDDACEADGDGPVADATRAVIKVLDGLDTVAQRDAGVAVTMRRAAQAGAL